MTADAARRRWLGALAAGATATLFPASLSALRGFRPPLRDACAADNVFATPLQIPGHDGWRGRLAVGADPLTLRAQTRDGTLQFAAEGNGRRYSNPTLAAAIGTKARITVANNLGEPTVVHWHGLTIDTRNDGNGETLIAPSTSFDYAFELRNRAGQYWYHPHPHGATARQTYRGLFGILEIEDDDERALRRALDLTPGSTELTLVLQDLRADAKYRYMPAPEDALFGWYGDLPQVNGRLRPFHDVSARRYRLRVLNASNARTYRLALRRDAGAVLPFRLLGTDGGLLAQAIACEQVFLAPAERVDLLVDFAGMPRGGFVLLESLAFDPMLAVPATQAARSDSATASAHVHGSTGFPAERSALADGAPFPLLQFRIRETGAAGPRVPASLSRLPVLPASTGDERPLRLGFAKGRWRINDRVYDMQATPIEIARGVSETWLLRNYHTSAPHAMHLHGFQFRVLERETSPDQLAPLVVDGKGRLATDLGSKDTVLVWPGESVRIAIDFRHPFAESQLYLLHCHNLEHEDGGMMLRVKVG